MDYAIRLRFLARAYVDAQNIGTDLVTGGRLAQEIQDPQLVPQLLGVVPLQGGGVQERLGLFSPDFSFQVVLQSESFDISQMNTTGAGSTMANLEAFAADAARVLSICANFYGRVPHRLALVQEGLLGEMPEAELRAVAGRLLRTPDSYQDPPPFEWDWKCSRRGSIELNGREEATNIVTTVKRVSGTLQVPNQQRVNFDRIRADIDFNTIGQERRGRFTPEDIAQFFQVVAIQEHRRLSGELVRFLRGGAQ